MKTTNSGRSAIGLSARSCAELSFRSAHHYSSLCIAIDETVFCPPQTRLNKRVKHTAAILGDAVPADSLCYPGRLLSAACAVLSKQRSSAGREATARSTLGATV